MNRFSLEVKVGIVVSLAVVLILGFLFILGQYNPFAKSYRIYVLYNFAGGIELGSPVRLAGVKVGKVDQIRFFEPGYVFQGEPVALSLRLMIDQRAKSMIREDSKFYINMAGIIGEKYIEVLPGSASAKMLENGASVRGIDPPRIEQLLSQGYDIFERVSKKLESFSEEDKEKMLSLFDNLVILVDNLNRLLEVISPQNSEERKELQARLKQLDETLTLLHSTSQRLDKISARLDSELETITQASIEKSIRQILQKEGITVNIGNILGKPKYPSSESERSLSEGGKKEAK